jgi:hypothetical protein
LADKIKPTTIVVEYTKKRKSKKLGVKGGRFIQIIGGTEAIWEWFGRKMGGSADLGLKLEIGTFSMKSEIL